LNLGLSYLDRSPPKILLFCGKGGVGKTTCASAAALHFAGKGFRTLLFSSDPTPSLSDILEQSVYGRIVEVKGVKGLEAVELDYEAIVDMWKKRFGDEVYEVISSFLPVGRDIIDYVAGAPGIDEEFALSYVLDLYESGAYDVIVWDTAPAGGTLSLVKLQDKFYRHLGEAAKLYARVKHALEVLVKGRVKRDPIEVISRWEELAKRVFGMLKDPGTQAIIVTIPEALGLRQTDRIYRELKVFNINVSRILVNYMLPEDVCTCDFHLKRLKMQRKYLDILMENYGKQPGVSILTQLPREVRGLEALRNVEALLFPV